MRQTALDESAVLIERQLGVKSNHTEFQPCDSVPRVISACEFLLGTAIVIRHNVFHVLPNEVPILFVLGLLSVRIRDGRWSAIGFKCPHFWWRIVWAPVLAHGLIDTFGLALVFFGLDK